MYILLCSEGAINVRMHRSVEMEALQGCMHCSTFSAMSYMCSVCVCVCIVYTHVHSVSNHTMAHAMLLPIPSEHVTSGMFLRL